MYVCGVRVGFLITVQKQHPAREGGRKESKIRREQEEDRRIERRGRAGREGKRHS